MSQKLYAVVETVWDSGKRVERDIDSKAKPEAKAKDELRALKLKYPHRTFSLQRQPSR